jgi:hypothetical protein
MGKNLVKDRSCKMQVDFEHKCGHVISVDFNVQKGEGFFVGFVAGASKGYDCPECSHRTAEENEKMLEEIVEMVSSGHREMRKKRLNEIFAMVKSVVFGKNMKFGERRFFGSPSTRFVGQRESANSRIMRGSWF